MRAKLLVGLCLMVSYQLLSWWMVRSVSNNLYVNQEAVFGLVGEPKLIALIVLVAILLLVKLIQSGLGSLGGWGLVLLTVGGVSNVIDRLVHGGVIDYVRFGQFSTFNLADVSIVFGAILLILDSPLSKRHVPASEPAAPPSRE